MGSKGVGSRVIGWGLQRRCSNRFLDCLIFSVILEGVWRGTSSEVNSILDEVRLSPALSKRQVIINDSFLYGMLKQNGRNLDSLVSFAAYTTWMCKAGDKSRR